VSLPSRAEFHFWTRLLNESSRANLLVDRALVSRAKLARLGSNSSRHKVRPESPYSP
jgi:hypothetical protein